MCFVGDSCLMKQGPRGADDLVSRGWSEKSPGSRVSLKLRNVLAVLDLLCCLPACASCGEPGLLFVVGCGLLIAVASLVGGHRLESTGSVAVVHWLSCPLACGIFPD